MIHRRAKFVPFSELSDENKVLTDAESAFKDIVAKIKSEVFKQALLAPIYSNTVTLPHQILASKKRRRVTIVNYSS